MDSCTPNTGEDQQEMFGETSFDNLEALSPHIPQDVCVKGGSKLPEGLNETRVIGKMKEIAQQNMAFKYIFRGAGAYSHHMSVIVRNVASRGEFLTSYTPYQAEASQGVLQSIFGYQTVPCELTGMDISSVSVCGGAAAAAETAAIYKDKKRSRVYLSVTTCPQITRVVKTHCFGSEVQVAIVPEKDGVTDTDTLRELLDDTASRFYVQQPSYYGNPEECSLLGEVTHKREAKCIMSCNPISLVFLPTPMGCGVNVAVDDGQPLGVPLCFGGSYLGFMTATSATGRELPGGIVKETRGADDKRTYVLAPQAREQHIRREETNSNMCSSRALHALIISIYMATMGGEGLRKTTVLRTSKAHYLKEQLEQAGLAAGYDREFFHEFVIEGNAGSSLILKTLGEKGIPRGLSLGNKEAPQCTTKRNRKKDINQAVQIVKEVYGE